MSSLLATVAGGLARARKLLACSAATAGSLLSANAQQPTAPEKLFDPIASVLQHPRCLNCHMIERPFQKDIQVPHAQMVVRGPKGTGAAGLQCAACHQSTNSADGKVPGAPHWHLAPLTMAWQGVSRDQICRQLKDPARNGNRKTAEQIIEHMKVDPLVLWAWTPGAGRTTPGLTHEEFLRGLHVWAEAGMPCAGEVKTEAR